jgi:hypothetical protein
MKSILPLSFAFIAATRAFAKNSNSYPNRGSIRDVILGGDNNRSFFNNGSSRYNGYIFSAKERDYEIQRINLEFDYKIRDVQEARQMLSSEKNYQIRQLEQQRRRQVKAMKDRFQDSRNQYNNSSYSRADRRW